jgi:hypothetical protein
MSVTREDAIKLYGWNALPVDPKLKTWLGDEKFVNKPVPQLCSQVQLPDTNVIKASLEYAKAELPRQTFNHSMRVFYYGALLYPCPFNSHPNSSRNGHENTAIPGVGVHHGNLVVDLPISRYWND